MKELLKPFPTYINIWKRMVLNLNFMTKKIEILLIKQFKILKNAIRQEIGNATGLEHKLEEMQRNFGQNKEEQATEEAVAASPLADILGEDFYDDIEFETDKELASEDLDIEYDE